MKARMTLYGDNFKHFKNVVTASSRILQAAAFEASSRGVFMSTMNRSRTVLIQVIVSPQFFYEYEVPGDDEGAVVFKPDLGLLSRILGSFDPDTGVVMVADGSDLMVSDTLGKKKFYLPLKVVDPQEDLIKNPMEFPVEAVVTFNEGALKEIVDAIRIVGVKGIFFEADGNSGTMTICTEKDDLNRFLLTYKETDSAVMKMFIEDGAEASGEYFSDQLEKILGFEKILPGLPTVSFGTDAPLTLTVETGGITFKAVIAPRVEVEVDVDVRESVVEATSKKKRRN